jgi:hypothetical protein
VAIVWEDLFDLGGVALFSVLVSNIFHRFCEYPIRYPLSSLLFLQDLYLKLKRHVSAFLQKIARSKSLNKTSKTDHKK